MPWDLGSKELMNENIVQQFLNKRKPSESGEIVTYDLREGIDFSKHKEVADIFSEIVIRKEAPNWFTIGADEVPEFDPVYTLLVLVPKSEDISVVSFVIHASKKSFKRSVKRNFEESFSDSVINHSQNNVGSLGDGLSEIFLDPRADKSVLKKQLRKMIIKIRRNVIFKGIEV